jgi:hypothetical protein
MLTGGFGALLAANISVAEQKIGVASAAKNQVEGIVGGVSRHVAAGSEVFSNETVRTGADSVALLLFLDQTNLTVGARSEVKLDRFVFNPSRGGNVVVEVGRGAFRFVTGTQNSTTYTVKTPLATIGVRGTVFEITTRTRTIGNKSITEETIVLLQGAILVHARDGRSQELLKPGSAMLLSNASGEIKLEGPFPADVTLHDTAGFLALPLYGSNFWFDRGLTRAPDSGLDLNSQLNAIFLRSVLLPAPPSCNPPPTCP